MLILRLVKHPNIIDLDCVYESPKTIYLVFDLCMSNLAKFFERKKKRFEVEETVKIIRSLASALAYLHKNGIVHRDLTLENILIAHKIEAGEKIQIKVSDFGLSAMRGGPGHENMLHEFCGTLAYMAPEVIATKSYSQQCDVWSMGVIMYVLMFGMFPFFSHDQHKLCKLIRKSEINFCELPCSEEARNLVSKLLEKNPAFRITAAETEQHPWISGAAITLKTPSSNVFHMMRMWKNEMLESTTEGGPSNLDSSKLIKTACTKEGLTLFDWNHSSAHLSVSKSVKPKIWLQPPKTAPSLDTRPTTSEGQSLGRSMTRSYANFDTSTSSDSSPGDHTSSFLKQRLEKNLRRNFKLPDFSYVSAKVDTNLKAPKK
ncbi:serine/threonine-protein kinase 33-like isoform X2 [Belonocnema kinseyi]|nr:serine/threonine-protein kinase 33-like isoform X2 [Belonocnema kinseyi]